MVNPMNTSVATYRRITEADLPRVIELEAVAFPTPWTAEQYTAVMKQGGCALFGAFFGEDLAGYVAVAVHKTIGEMEVYNIAVDERFRRRGIGKKLLELSLAAAGKNGTGTTFLEVRLSNVAAIALYESLGFIRAGVRKGYYHDTGEDALVYTRSLS
ncbi:MAG: [Ribosomal protein S18]-alanine N-acetyltransferase [Desulfovibrio sp.]